MLTIQRTERRLINDSMDRPHLFDLVSLHRTAKVPAQGTGVAQHRRRFGTMSLVTGRKVQSRKRLTQHDGIHGTSGAELNHDLGGRRRRRNET